MKSGPEKSGAGPKKRQAGRPSDLLTCGPRAAAASLRRRSRSLDRDACVGPAPSCRESLYSGKRNCSITVAYHSFFLVILFWSAEEFSLLPPSDSRLPSYRVSDFSVETTSATARTLLTSSCVSSVAARRLGDEVKCLRSVEFREFRVFSISHHVRFSAFDPPCRCALSR